MPCYSEGRISAFVTWYYDEKCSELLPFTEFGLASTCCIILQQNIMLLAKYDGSLVHTKLMEVLFRSGNSQT